MVFEAPVDYDPAPIGEMPAQWREVMSYSWDATQHAPTVTPGIAETVSDVRQSDDDEAGELVMPHVLPEHYFDFPNGYRLFVVRWMAGTMPSADEMEGVVPPSIYEEDFFTVAPYLGKERDVPSSARDLYTTTRGLVRKARGGVYDTPLKWAPGQSTILLFYRAPTINGTDVE